MSTEKTPVTPAARSLRAAGIRYSDHLYAYEEHGGTRVSARELKVGERAVVKTLVIAANVGYLDGLDPNDRRRILNPVLVDVAVIRA